MSEYIAAMRGVRAIQEHDSQPTSANGLTNDDVDDLKALLKEHE